MFKSNPPGLCSFSHRGHVYTPLRAYSYNPNDFDLFDHNGYDLTNIEIAYCENDGFKVSTHRHYGHIAIKQPWIYKPGMEWSPRGAHINHAAIFERKGYAGDALYQLREIAHKNPIAYKIINIKPKWGVDLSIDYVDDDGNCFEVLHFEYDVFDFNDANKIKEKVEQIVTSTDWDNAARVLWSRRDEWINLNFFKMSDYKCKFFGLPKERFKETIWHGN